jgi:hypothetical protein
MSNAKTFVCRGIETNDDFAEWALIDIYRRQTSDEVEHRTTIWSNGHGFSVCDSRTFSRLAEKALTGTLCASDCEILRHRDARGRTRLGKYAEQIVNCILRGGE